MSQPVISIKAEVRNRQHIESLQRDEYLKLLDLKTKGASCRTCLHKQDIFFVMRCLKKRKQIVKPYNICHFHHCKIEGGKRNDQDRTTAEGFL